MRSPTDLLVPVPPEVDASMRRTLGYGASVIAEAPYQFIRRGRCFRLDDGRLVRCASVFPEVRDWEMVFVHTLEPMSDEEVASVFGDGSPEEVQSRAGEAADVRRMARRMRRYEGLRDLIPVMESYADSLDGGRR